MRRGIDGGRNNDRWTKRYETSNGRYFYHHQYLSALTKEDFKAYFDQYFDPIRNYLYYRGADAELATDLAQEVFMKLWEKQIEIEPRTKGLLYKMASDLFVSHVRRNSVANTYITSQSQQQEEHDPAASLEYKELKETYEQALAKLPDKQRAVFLMNRVEALTYKEIAERLELSVKAVEKRMSQALAHLRETLIAP